MKFLAPGFLFLFLCITISVSSGENGPRSGPNHSPRENEEPGCRGRGPHGRRPPGPPPPPEDDPDAGDDGNNDGDGGDDGETEDGEADRIQVRRGQGELPRLSQDRTQRKRS